MKPSLKSRWVASGFAFLLASTGWAAPQTPPVSDLMDWAERTYPQFFPGTQTNQSLAPYIYRHYPATGNYVGVAGNAVYILGPVAGSNEVPLYMGELASFACQVHPGSCASSEPNGANDCDDLTLTRVQTYEARRRTVAGPISFEVVETRGPLEQVEYRGRSLLSWLLRHESTGPGAGDRSSTDDRWYFERSGARSFAHHGQVQDQTQVLSGVTRRSRIEYVWSPPWMQHESALNPGQDYTVTVQSSTTQTVDGVTTGPTASTDKYRTRFVGYETRQTAGAGSFEACRFVQDNPDQPGNYSEVWTLRGYGLELEREVYFTVAGRLTLGQRGQLLSLTVNGQRLP